MQLAKFDEHPGVSKPESSKEGQGSRELFERYETNASMDVSMFFDAFCCLQSLLIRFVLAKNNPEIIQIIDIEIAISRSIDPDELKQSEHNDTICVFIFEIIFAVNKAFLNRIRSS